MPSSANKGYTQPAFNTEVGTWGTDLNTNFSGIVDNNLGGVASVSLSSSNVTLTSTQAQNLTITLTGTLLANVIVKTPCIGFFFVVNNTTGNFTVTFQANFGAGDIGSGLVIPQSNRLFLVSDTANGIQLAAAPAVATPSPSSIAQNVTASSSSINIDMSLGWNVALTLSATVNTFTVSNWPVAGTFGRLVLDISSTGAFNITAWPGTTIWIGGSAPTITSGTGKKDTIVLTSNGGSSFRGYLVAQNMS